MESPSEETRVKRRARSSSILPPGRPLKRRRFSTIEPTTSYSPTNASSFKHNHHWRSLRTRLHNKLVKIETRSELLQNIRQQMDKVFDREWKKLQLQGKAGRESLNRLEHGLDMANIFQDKVSSRLDFTLPSSDIESPSKSNFETQLMSTKWDGTVNSNLREHFSNDELNKSQSCMVKIEKLNTEKILWEERKSLLARAARVDELEQELESSREVISALHEAANQKKLVEQRASDLKLALKRAESREQKLQAKCAELSKIAGRTSGPWEQCGEAESRLELENRELRNQIDALMRKHQGTELENDAIREQVTELRQQHGPSDRPIMTTIKIEAIDTDDPIDVVGDLDGTSDIIDVVGDGPTNFGNSETDLVHGGSLNDSFDDTQDDVNGESLVKPEDRRSLLVGKMWLFPSNPNFFDINFDNEYTFQNSSVFICNTCEKIMNARPKVIDHIWSAHYKGFWPCLHCNFQSHDRYVIVIHIKKYHPNELKQSG